MREKLEIKRPGKFFIGITPACAGKTNGGNACAAQTKDHPRVCGKNYKRLGDEGAHMGSPPRVREKHEVSQVG